MKQETRQWLAATIAYGGWTVAVVLTYLRTTEVLAMRFSMLIILVIGIAMAAGIKLSRMRLTATMLDVYRAGVETARIQKEEREDMERRIIDAQGARDSDHG